MGGRTTFQPRAHPRSRGENTVCSFTPGMSGGSSPLTRGKRFSARSSSDASGLIPAHAGKTPRRGGDRRCIGAHPRSRGENRACVHRAQPTQGSSPLTRGKPATSGLPHSPHGLIPAHAGKTPIDDLCGAKHLGSSPLTRGKHGYRRKGVPRGRLIPAHAGKTEATAMAVSFLGAHPRSRGENDEAGKPVAADDGSSPLTRGKRCALGPYRPW